MKSQVLTVAHADGETCLLLRLPSCLNPFATASPGCFTSSNMPSPFLSLHLLFPLPRRSAHAWLFLILWASGQRSPPLSPCLQSPLIPHCSLGSPYFICVTASYHLIPGVHMVRLQERGSLSVSFRPWNRPCTCETVLLLSC